MEGCRRDAVLLLTPPSWMRSVIRVCAASAVVIVVVISVALWSTDGARQFWVAWNASLEWCGGWPPLGDCYVTPASCLASLALAVAAYHCIRLQFPGRDDRPHERVLYIGAGHALALLVLCYSSVSIFRRAHMVLLSMNGWLMAPEPLFYLFWPVTPNLGFLVLTLAALGKHLGEYFVRCAWLLQTVVIGVSGTALLIQLFMLTDPYVY